MDHATARSAAASTWSSRATRTSTSAACSIDGAYATPTTAEGVVLDDGDGRPDGDGPYRKSAGLTPHNGTIAIVAGHGGAGVSRKGTMPIMREIVVENGSLLLDIRGDDTLTGTMIDQPSRGA